MLKQAYKVIENAKSQAEKNEDELTKHSKKLKEELAKKLKVDRVIVEVDVKSAENLLIYAVVGTLQKEKIDIEQLKTKVQKDFAETILTIDHILLTSIPLN